MKRILHIMSVIFLAASCGKVGDDATAGSTIDFKVIAPEVSVTKAEVTEDNITEVFVTGTVTNLSSGSSSILLNASKLSRKTGAADLWSPATAKEWQSNSFYEFYGYAYNTSAGLTISNSQGTQISVTQPATEVNETIDYLLAYRYETTTGSDSNYPLVPIRLEHAMAKVSVDLEIAQAMTEFDISVTLTLKGFYNTATMACNPKLYSAPGGNSWVVSGLGISGAPAYTVTEEYKDLNITDDKIDENVISFMAIPVSSANMKDYKLEFTYTVTETGDGSEAETRTFTREFPLADVTDGWKSGHHVKYVLRLDDSIHLMGTITDFVETDYIEGAVLPK